MQAAARAGDIGMVISLITQASVRTPGEFIRDSLGTITFLVYLFEDTFKREAGDMEDLIDGLLYLDAKNYQNEAAVRDKERLAEMNRVNQPKVKGGGS